MRQKYLVVGIILLFIGTAVIPSTAQNNENATTASRGHWLYVGGSGPGNYTKIQNAIDNASNGDTIIVYSGSYNEAINLNKQLFLKGIKLDGQDFPLINGGNDHTTVTISNDSCSFENFSVRNGPSGFSQKAIYVLSDYNIIKNCTIFNTGLGIYLSSSCGNCISDNEIKDGGPEAIGLYSSCNNSIFNNDLHNHNNDEILFTDNSIHNRFYHNYVHQCTHNPAVVIESSPYNIIEENNISENYEGLVIRSSPNTSVLRNSFVGDGVLFDATLQELYSYSIVDNLVDGKPLRYYVDQNDITVPADTGQVILINCSYFTIRNFTLIGAEHGILLFFSSHNSITDNTIAAGPAAVQLYQSHDNDISRNIINGGRGGIFLSSSNRNNIFNNTIQNQSKLPGIYLVSSTNTKIIDNLVKNCRVGINPESGSENNEIIRNTVSASAWAGIEVESNNNYVFHNEVSDCSVAGILAEGGRNSIDNNFISKCDCGIDLIYASITDVTDNMVSENNFGISVSECNGISIAYNQITDNNVGVTLSPSGFISVKKNNLIQNIRDVRFSMRLLDVFTNKFKRNYWGMFSLKPHIVIGTLEFIIPIFSFPPYILVELPWFYFDWFPAQKPYDIGRG
jgi:parallel beta-helix repeat protein